MKKTFMLFIFAMFAFYARPAWAARPQGIAVADAARVMRESVPGRAAHDHLQQVRGIFQKSMDALREAYKGLENNPEAIASLRESHAALELQLEAERRAVGQILAATMENVVRVWIGVNKQYSMVLSRDMVLGYNPEVDVTDSILNEMNRERPQFPGLPEVSVTVPGKTAPHPSTKNR